MRRTVVVNQVRGLLLQRGLTLPKGRSHLEQALPEILTDPALRLPGLFRVLLLLPFRLVGIAVGGALAMVWAIVTLPFRVIRRLA